jgi:hypothetical protein
MRKVWILDTETKGTGAQVVPLEKAQEKPAPSPRRKRKAGAARAAGPRPSAPKAPVQRTSEPLPPGHVRKKATGEIGRVQSVDPRAGTATVQWLRQGRTSTVPLSELSRR